MSHRRNYRKPALAVLVALSAVGRTAASTGIAEDAQDTLVDDLNDLDEYDLQVFLFSFVAHGHPTAIPNWRFLSVRRSGHSRYSAVPPVAGHL